jgi:hypothetical protein
MTTNFFNPSLLLLFLDPGWVKIRIRDKHPGSATLTFGLTFYSSRGQWQNAPSLAPSPRQRCGPAAPAQAPGQATEAMTSLISFLFRYVI